MSGNEPPPNRGTRGTPLPAATTSAASAAKSSYVLRKKGKTIAEMLVKEPQRQKRTLTSPESEEKISKVFVVDSPKAKEDNLLPGNNKPEDKQTCPTEPVKAQVNHLGDNDNNDAQTNPVDPNTPNDFYSRQAVPLKQRENAINEITRLITEMKHYADTVKELDPPVSKLINKAFHVCSSNNLLPDSIALDLIQKAKDSQNINDWINVCHQKWPTEAFKNTTIIPDQEVRFHDNTLALIIKRGQINLLEQTQYLENVPALHKIDNDCPKLVTIKNTETINEETAVSSTTFVVTLEDTGTPESFIEVFEELKGRLDDCPGQLQLKTMTGNPNDLRKAFELVMPIDRKASIIMPVKSPRQKTESVVIKQADMTYADLVKTIRDNVNGEELGVRILNAKKNTEGHLEMRVKGPMTRLTDSIKRVVPGIQTTFRTAKTTLHIRDLEEDVIQRIL